MNINVDPQKTLTAGKKISETAQIYMDEISKVYSYMDDLNSAWKGTQASRFVDDVNENRSEFESFGKELSSFGERLQNIGKDYQGLEEM